MNNNAYMMKTATQTRRTYEAPDTSVDLIEMEQCILSTQLPNMDPNTVYDEDFDD